MKSRGIEAAANGNDLTTRIFPYEFFDNLAEEMHPHPVAPVEYYLFLDLLGTKIGDVVVPEVAFKGRTLFSSERLLISVFYFLYHLLIENIKYKQC